MKRRISAAMMVSGTILLLLSMIFSTVSFAAPNLGSPSWEMRAAVIDDCVQECSTTACMVGETQQGSMVDASYCVAGGCTDQTLCETAAGGCGGTWSDPSCSEGDCTDQPLCETALDGCGGTWTEPGCSQGACADETLCETALDGCGGNWVEAGQCIDCEEPDGTAKECPDHCDNSSSACERGVGEGACIGTWVDASYCAGGTGTCTDETLCETGAGGCGGTWNEGGCSEGDCADQATCETAAGGCGGTWDEGGCSQGDCTDSASCETAAGGCGSEWVVDQQCGDWGPCGGGTPLDCNDAVDCTIDSCDDQEGCEYEPDHTSCADELECSVDTCHPLDGCQHDYTDCPCEPGETSQCGTTDEGPCEYGEMTCGDDGTWGECVGAVEPIAEICDGLDNDCDGSVDEGLGTTTCGVGECEVTVDNCVDGELQECVPGELAEEICDGLDNDCDGSVDEGLGTTTCGVGECQVTVDNCVDGQLQECVPDEPTEEICDDKDNDCDGKIDEGGVCGAPPPEKEREPEPAPTPTPTPVVEVLGVEELPTAGIMPVGPALPILPMIFSSLALIGGGLLLWGDEDE